MVAFLSCFVHCVCVLKLVIDVGLQFFKPIEKGTPSAKHIQKKRVLCYFTSHLKVLETTRKKNVITAHAKTRYCYAPPFYTLLENFPGSQVKGSITLLLINMSRMVAELIEALANQFGRKDKDFGEHKARNIGKIHRFFYCEKGYALCDFNCNNCNNCNSGHLD